MRLQNEQLQVGPVKNIQWLFVLLDRQLLFYRHIINWSHGRRDYATAFSTGEKQAFTARWGKEELDICTRFFTSVQNNKLAEQHASREALSGLLGRALEKISCADT